MPGGDTAIHEVWRIALALLDEAFEGKPPLERLPVFARVSRQKIAAIRQMVAAGVNAPMARGVGRYFDGVGAILLGKAISRYEGEVALAVNGAADPTETGIYPFTVEEVVGPRLLDLRPMVRSLVEELFSGVPAPVISARFHNTLARATKDLLRRSKSAAGNLPVVLTGGCFQNALLAERLLEQIGDDFPVFLHHRVPPGDGGIALGQAVAAAAMARVQKGGC